MCATLLTNCQVTQPHGLKDQSNLLFGWLHAWVLHLHRACSVRQGTPFNFLCPIAISAW